MPDGATPLVGHDFSWHDGVLVDLQFAGFGGESTELRLTLDLYPDTDPQSERRRYLCVGSGVVRFFMKGDLPQLAERLEEGNIDWMRMDFTQTTEIVIVLLFGGYMEIEAANFTLPEMNS
jgi:hypothetical protein